MPPWTWPRDELVVDLQILHRDAGLHTPAINTPAKHGDVLGAQLQQRTQRGAGAAPGAGLHVAAGEEERGDAGGDLQVEGRGAVGRHDGQRERVGRTGHTGGPEQQRPQ